LTESPILQDINRTLRGRLVPSIDRSAGEKVTEVDPTSDLVDKHGDRIRSCSVQFRQYGRVLRFSGPIRTIKTFRDNALIKAMLSDPGSGSVLVIDGAASLESALVGDLIAGLALRNGWAGLVIWGAVRDSVALAQLDLGIKALGSNPLKSGKNSVGHVDVPVEFGGVTFRRGDWLYSDEDGIVMSDQQL
jgi:regulator of ribonuclease activity A